MVFVTTKPENASDLGELATSLAVLVLFDSGKEVTVDNINAITAAAGISGVSSVFASSFSSAVAGQNLGKLLAGPKPGAGAPAGGAPTSSSGGAAAAAPAEEKKPEKPESEEDLGQGGLFGEEEGGDDY